MGYRKSKHYNATFKYIKEKKIALQKDIQDIMNGSVQTAIEQLINEGKIKRKKVGVRYKNGNLNYQWLVYITGTNQNELLDYEKELINRPYESPLKVHHCYKKDNEILLIPEHQENSNVIDMAEYVRVNNYDLSIKEYNGQRVVTAIDIAKLHNKDVREVNQQLQRNKRHFIENEDYFIVSKEQSKITESDFKKYFTSNRQKELFIFTESGYLLLTKTFTDGLSWEVQRNLVNTYFKMKQLAEQNNTEPIPVGKIESLDIMEMMIQEMKKDRERVDKIEEKLNSIVNILSN